MDALTPDPETSARSAQDISDPSAGVELHVDWFRQATPYIDAYRSKTFVLCIDDSVLASTLFSKLIQDIALLKTLGVRLILVYGLRQQIDQQLACLGQQSQYSDGLRITNEQQLATVMTEVGRARVLFESQLSMGLPNSPRTGARVNIASGNFVTAQPYGVINGIDYQHTGIVRQIHSNSIRRQIDNDQIVLLSPLGYSRTGEIFNLEAIDVATQTAIAMQAEKLIFICAQRITHADGSLIRQSTPSELVDTMATQKQGDRAARLAKKAVEACRSGVKRVHILSNTDANALLKELFTRDGFGTMINADSYETLRPASILDVGGIIELIQPLEQDGTLVKRSREQLELEIDHYHVIDRDGTIICCAALLPPTESAAPNAAAEIACLATHPQYRRGGRAEAMLLHLENLAIAQRIPLLYVLTTRTNHWFLEHGYSTASSAEIPIDRQHTLNQARKSKILVKQLGAGR